MSCLALPNIITLLRIGITPCICWAIAQASWYWAFSMFTAACISDFIDGHIARKWHLGNTLGMILDPLADKILMLSVSMFLAQAGRMPMSVLWPWNLMMARDLCITLWRSGRQGPLSSAVLSAKAKTVLQMLTLGGMIMPCSCIHSFKIIFLPIAAWGAFFLSIYSAFVYIYPMASWKKGAVR